MNIKDLIICIVVIAISAFTMNYFHTEQEIELLRQRNIQEQFQAQQQWAQSQAERKARQQQIANHCTKVPAVYFESCKETAAMVQDNGLKDITAEYFFQLMIQQHKKMLRF